MNILETVITGILALWLGSMEYRMRKVVEKAEDKTSRKDVIELIDMKQEVVKAAHLDLKEDLNKIEKKIDKLLESK